MAVWDRGKAVTTIALSVWGTNVAFMIQGEFSPFRPVLAILTGVIWYQVSPG